MRRSILLTAVASLSFTAATRGGSLGVAQDYNAFLFSNFSGEYADVGGRLAVGGNATFNGYPVGQSASSSGTNLVVGGNATITGGTFNGSAIVGGKTTLGQAQINGNLTTGSYIDPASAWNGTSATVTGTIKYTTSYTNGQWYNGAKQQISSFSLPVDFAEAKTALTAVSSQLAATASTGSVAKSSSTFTFTGTSAGANYFNISAADLAVGTNFILNLPTNGTPTLADDAYAVINVTGATAALGEKLTIQNVGWFNATSGKKILWNFNNWDAVEFKGSFNGSVLATGAAVDSTWGNFNGTLVANSFNGHMEFHDYSFDYPSPELNITNASVPLPTAALSASLLLGTLSLARRRG